MLFIILAVVVPVCVFLLLPILLCRTSPQYRPGGRLILAAGCVCYAVSWFLPSPLIEGEDTAFTTHFVGGGCFTGFVWLYGCRQLGLKLSAPLQVLTLYALVSSLGVANELFELLATRFHWAVLTPCDTWWDLLANTSGALSFWLVYRAFLLLRPDAV